VPYLRWVVVFVFCWPELAESDDRAVVNQDQDATAELYSELRMSIPVSISGASDANRGHIFGHLPDVGRYPDIRMDFSKNSCVLRFGGPDLHAQEAARSDHTDVPITSECCPQRKA
jgi:hypothetical protein